MEVNNNNDIIFSNNLSYKHLNDRENYCAHNTSSPAFKGRWETFLDKSGYVMNKIEQGGFLVLFLIQDFLGMTVPRTFAGFLRDKDETGEYNIQEGLEVFGRESLTGPSMMAVAPLSLYLLSKPAGKSISINTELIKRYGNSLKEFLSSQDFDKELLKDGKNFKTEFYRTNIENILKQTLNGESENFSKKELKTSVDYILKQIENYENIPKDAKLKKFFGKTYYRDDCLENITSHINNLYYNSSSKLDMLRKVKFGVYGEKDAKVFDTKKAFEGLIKYSDDAIKFNKNLSKLDSTVAESLKHSTLGKRILVNIGMISATLGILSVLPKLYLRANTAPGARKNVQNESKQENVSFKGKNSGMGIFERIGKAIEKNKKDFISSEFEYNGHNFTNTLMACLSVFGLITPRCWRAYNRAQVDERTGKKDKTELWEIIIRDITSSLAVVFAVPMMTRALVTSYEKHTGFVLMQKDRTMSKLKTSLDLLNPYSKAHVLSNAEISALYDNINSKEKLINFCKYIDKNNGDLQKILSKSENINELFNDKTKSFEGLKKLNKAESNKEIISFFEKIESQVKKLGKPADKESVNKIITKVMNGISKGGSSKITATARGLNSLPGIIATLFISPYILGWLIPRLTYKNTRRIHAKEDRMYEQQKAQQLKASA